MTKEILVQAPLETVWHAWTTEEGLSFVSGKSNVDLEIGGRYEWFLDLEPDEQARRGSEGSKVLMHGWQDGEAWDRGWEYFDRAWDLVLERLKVVVEGGG